MIPKAELFSDSVQELQRENVRSIMNAGELLLARSQLEIGGKYQESFLSGGNPYQLDVNIGHLPQTVHRPLALFSAFLELWTDESVSASERLIQFREHKPGQILINSEMFTESGYESRGYGEGLLRFSHRLVFDLLDLDPLRDKSVVWEIVDKARGRQDGKKRDGWTSRLARELGYEDCGMNEFFHRVFRFKFQ